MKAEHNTYQQTYYSDPSRKKTMIPSDTPYIRRHLKELIQVSGITKSDRILEVGCGMGRYTVPLLEMGYNITGLDLTPQLLENLRERLEGKYDVPLYCTDILNFPEELTGSFDKIIGFFMLHHLHDLGDSFNAMHRLLKESGSATFLEPNAYNMLYYIQILITPKMTWKGDKGVAQMRWGKVSRAMQQAELAPLKVFRFGFFPPFIANKTWGARLERWLESVPLWRFFLPFQIFHSQRT